LLRAYGAKRLGAACRRALDIRTLSYKSVKSILSTGFHQAPDDYQYTLFLPTTPTSAGPGTTPRLPRTGRSPDDRASPTHLDLLRELRLSGMAQAFEEQAAMPDIAELSFEELSLLFEREKTERSSAATSA